MTVLQENPWAGFRIELSAIVCGRKSKHQHGSPARKTSEVWIARSADGATPQWGRRVPLALGWGFVAEEKVDEDVSDDEVGEARGEGKCGKNAEGGKADVT